MENEVDGRNMVFHKKPVAHILALAVDRKRFMVPYVVDDKGNEFFRKLIAAVVVGAVGNHHGQAVGVEIGAHQVVGRGFGCRIGAARIVARGFGEEAVFAQGAVYFVGADMIEQLAFEIVFPCGAGGVEQGDGAHDIGAYEFHGIGYRTVYMRFGGQMYHAVETVFFKEFRHTFLVHDIALLENIIGRVLHIFQIFQIAGIGKFIEIHHAGIGIFLHPMTHQMRTDEPGASCNQNIFHINML